MFSSSSPSSPKRRRLHLSSSATASSFATASSAAASSSASLPPPLPFFDSLPDDLLLSILSSLSSSASSPSHLINAMLSCKRFLSAGTHPLVLSVLSSHALSVKARAWSDASRTFLQRCADAGNADAAYILGMIRFYCLKEKLAGASLLAKAAMKAHHPEALHSLAIIQFNGSLGFKKDRNLRCGAALCAKAAARGHVGAMREYGHCLQDGYGVIKNEEEGKRMLLKASAREAAARLTEFHGEAALKAMKAATALVKRKNSELKLTEQERKNRTVLGIPLGQAAVLKKMLELEKLRQGTAPPTPKMLPQRLVHPANRFLVEWFEAKPEAERMLSMCGNSGCGRVELRRNEFRRCSACGAANYCSRSCQSQDWSLRHKLQCRGGAAAAAVAAAGRGVGGGPLQAANPPLT